MKIFKRILLILLLIIVVAVLSIYFVLLQQKPVYSGQLSLPKLEAKTDVYFDPYGIPHIYGQNEQDVYRTLGYLHAQDRLFQMELIRRVSAGRLSEVFGSSTLDIDRFFRMLGMAGSAQAAADDFAKDSLSPEYIASRAYIDGINEFIKNGSTPVEFRMLHLPKEAFTMKDIFLVVDFMAFNFQIGFRTDPLLTRILSKTSLAAMADLGITNAPANLSFLNKPSFALQSLKHPENKISDFIEDLENSLPR